MKLFKKYMPLFLSVAVLTATSMHSIDAAQDDKKKSGFFTKIKKSFTKFFTGKWKKMDENDWLRVVGTTLFTCASGYSFYWMFFKKSIMEEQHPRTPGSDDQIINNRPAFYNNRLNAAVTLRQVPAVSQGANNTCGYHALLNGIKVVNALHANPNNLENLEAILINDQSNNLINERIGQQGWWRQYVIQRRQQFERMNANDVQNGEILFGYELVDLACIEQDELPLAADIQHNYPRTLNVQCGIQIFQNIQSINDVGGEWMQNVRDGLNNNDAYFKLFLIRAGANSGRDAGGHWYTVVLYKAANGQRHYITMDSSGRNNGWFRVQENLGVGNIINIIEGTESLRSYTENQTFERIQRQVAEIQQDQIRGIEQEFARLQGLPVQERLPQTIADIQRRIRELLLRQITEVQRQQIILLQQQLGQMPMRNV